MFETIFLESILKRFREYKSLGDKTFAQLNDEDFLFQPNEASNSLAVIIQHMNGNMRSRWTNFLTEDGEKEWRRREEEFDNQPQSKSELLQLWEEGWKVLFDTLNSLTADDLSKTITIRSQTLTVIDAINRQLAHYAYHAGQIVYIGRWRRDGNWQSLSIPKGGSSAYNEKLRGTR
jgi:uncharacterized damage-inducible protein DinB